MFFCYTISIRIFALKNSPTISSFLLLQVDILYSKSPHFRLLFLLCRLLLGFVILVSCDNMAWRCSGGSNLQLVENLAAAGILKTPSLIGTFKLVDRGNYAPRKAYEDSPQSIGFGATISAPHMHAYAMEYLQSAASLPTASILVTPS